MLQTSWYPGIDSHTAVCAAQVGMALVPACWRVRLSPCTLVCSAVGGHRAGSGPYRIGMAGGGGGGFQNGAVQVSCYCYQSVQFSRSVMSDSLQTHE